MTGNVGQRFDRLPETAADRDVDGRASREEIVDWWHDRFGVPQETFAEFSFWEKGAGKIWVFAGDHPTPVPVEALGLFFMRTRQRHWKPTTEAVQRFGGAVTRNVIELDAERAERFARGDDQDYDWDGDWGYVVVTHDVAGAPTPIGVGLYVHDELRSVIPKGRRRP